MFSTLLSLAALTSVATATWSGTVHDVYVGGLKSDGTPNLVYSPNQVTAYPGDRVRFHFNVKNHTVTQSSFDSPCSKLADNWGNPIGFDSGFMPVAPGTTNLPTFDVLINDTKPIWGYCRQTNPPNKTHCQSGMVFSINAPSSGNTFDKFLAMAQASTSQNSGAPPSGTVTTTDFITTTVTQTVTHDETVTVTKTLSSSWAPATHTITVGGDAKTVGFRYMPPNITADVGDYVKFRFMVKNHTVTQSSFNDPCRKLEATTWPPVQGFDSGFMPVDANATEFPEFMIKVNDTNPIWGYCRQQAANFSHCGVGMVFSINAKEGTDKSFEAFQLLAVQKNGTGFVNPFGNLTAPPYPSSSLSNSKSVKNLDALGSSTDSDSDMLNKLLSYAPATIVLLVAAIVLLLALSVMSFLNLRRSQSNVLPTRSIVQSYKAVPLTMPSSKLQDDGSHDYDMPRYNDL